MMKWFIILGIGLLSAGCCCNTGVVAYRQVVVAPVIEPVQYGYYSEPLDVTTTTIDFY